MRYPVSPHPVSKEFNPCPVRLFLNSNKAMNKHKFTIAEHFALWRVYGQKCFYCQQPLAFTEVTIDHIIPEHIADDAEQLQAIKIQYGLDVDFSINDYGN